MSIDINEKEESRKAGRKVLFILLGFFAVFASVDMYFTHLALQTNWGVVTENAYKRGLNYNALLEEARMRKARKQDGTTQYPTPRNDSRATHGE